MKYIITLLVTVVLAFMASTLFMKISKKSPKSHRISCHKSTTTFEKVIDKNGLKGLQNALKDGDFSLHATPLPSKYMPSQLFLHVNVEDIKREFLALFPEPKGGKKDANIEIFVYENDKLDPKKKTKKSKLYEGYLLFNFSYKDRLIYKLQLDFYEKNGKDIAPLLGCAKESVWSIK